MEEGILMTNNEVKNALYCARQHAEETVCEECDLYNICDHSTIKDMARIWIKSFEEIDKLRAEIEQLNGIISRDVDKHECYVISKKHRS